MKYQKKNGNENNMLKQDIEKIKSHSKSSIIVNTSKIFNISGKPNVDLLINYEKTNNIKNINKFHEAANQALVQNGGYISCAESLEQRKARKAKVFIFFISQVILFFDFIYKRVIPKLPILKQIYFFFTKGKNRVMTETEIIGRLVSCGFKIEKTYKENGLTYIFARKVRKPFYDMNPSYGPIFKMRRVGYQGKIISVFKFRTMSPYSEYVQTAIIKKNKLDKTGKINNDYRVTFYGKFLRKYWIDEFPMILNWIKRDLKIVGVRPLSEDYFKRYPKDLQNLRIKTKPGLVPPYYVDLPVSFEEICESERRYLKSYFERPIRTDFNYFLKAFYNIVIKRKRSG